MPFRLPAALVAIALAVLLLGTPSRNVTANETLLSVVSTVTYDVQTSGDGSVHVTWDAAITDNDPATDITQGSLSYYASVGLPILRGATDIAATDSTGAVLQVDTDDPGGRSIDEGAIVHFARGIFFRQTYSFQLTYSLTNARSEAVLVTPNYAFLPAIAAGESATVIINAPGASPWATTIDPRDCPVGASANSFTCTGSNERTYLAALVEVSQPDSVSTSSFDVPLQDTTVNVALTYFQGEDATAQHQQALTTASLPVIERIYGFDYSGPAPVNIRQGGRQSSLGYEGLASCSSDTCELVVSPVAGDYTLLHELSHMWSNIYTRRWLAEGFAEFVAETAGPQLEAGLVVGEPPPRTDPLIPLALDDWGDADSLIGADASTFEIEDAGYTYSLRFIQELRDQFGIEALQAVNRNIATSGTAADSQRYMDLLEDATRSNLDALFLRWVFPSSFRPIIEDRRDAIDRLSDLRARLIAEGLPDDIAIAIQTSIRAWDFDEALTSLDDADAGLETYAELRGSLDSLQTRADSAGLTLPESLTDDLNRFNFENVRSAIEQANTAIASYNGAKLKVGESRNIWQRFGLIGSDPDGALNEAKESFARADFDISRQHSQHAVDLVDDASSVAFRRLLVVAGFFGLLVLALVIALLISRLREREFAER